MGIFKSRFYLSLEVPVLEKIIGVIVTMILVYAFFSIAYRYVESFRAGVVHGSKVPWGVFLVLILLILSKSLDGISRKLEALGLKITHQASQYFWAAEEVLELGIPIMIFLTAMIYFEEKAYVSDLDSA
jgi:hypothetical protein